MNKMQRADFLEARTGIRLNGENVMLQARFRDDGSRVSRIGFTCSKKIGNAVERNGAKRRLRAAAREVLCAAEHKGWDYVFIGKTGKTTTCSFSDLVNEMSAMITKAHQRDLRETEMEKDFSP